MNTYSVSTCFKPDQIPAAGPPPGFKSAIQIKCGIDSPAISRGAPTTKTRPGQAAAASTSKVFPADPKGNNALSMPLSREALPPATIIESTLIIRYKA